MYVCPYLRVGNKILVFQREIFFFWKRNIFDLPLLEEKIFCSWRKNKKRTLVFQTKKIIFLWKEKILLCKIHLLLEEEDLLLLPPLGDEDLCHLGEEDPLLLASSR